MDKKTHIIDALEALFEEGNGGSASVSDIAKKAGIAKGGLYYYFQSKEEVVDALVERHYEAIIRACHEQVKANSLPPLYKLAFLLKHYRSSYVNHDLDKHLHMPQNASIHQKSLAKILNSLSILLCEILEEGIQDGSFQCDYPQEHAEIILSVFTFLLDPGIFTWTPHQQLQKLQALAQILEKGLSTPTGSFSFLYQSE